jgi:hypothetical protein
MKILSISWIFFLGFAAFSQSDPQPVVRFSGYVETYYSFDFNRPEDHLRPFFLYNFNRHNEFSVNIALLRASFEQGKVRGTVALMGGTYAQYNLADEPEWAQMVNEASIGVQLHSKLWLDVGIMPSHIGFESWIGTNGWHLSRSIMAENSPYFLTGARLTYSVNENTDLTLWLANGWQRVQRNPRNQSLGLGFSINHRPIPGLELHYANYLGNEQPDPLRLERFFNNFYAQYSPGKWGWTIGADYGIEESIAPGLNQWFGVTTSIRRTLNERFVLAGRGEYYSDPRGVIVNGGIKVTGFSANIDYSVTSAAKFRLEARQFMSQDPVFLLPEAKFSRGNTAVSGAISFCF